MNVAGRDEFMASQKIVPVRVQRKRTKGFKLQDASPNGLPVVYVGRPSNWGNPYKVGDTLRHENANVQEVLEFYEQWVKMKIHEDDSHFLDPLKGKDLACWCPIDKPCHADVLLKLLTEKEEIPA